MFDTSKLSVQERKALYEKVNELRREGVDFLKACEQVGIRKSTYYSWRMGRGGFEVVLEKHSNPFPRKRKKIVHQGVAPIHHQFIIPSAEPSSKLVILVGSSDQVNAALEKLARIEGR